MDGASLESPSPVQPPLQPVPPPPTVKGQRLPCSRAITGFAARLTAPNLSWPFLLSQLHEKLATATPSREPGLQFPRPGLTSHEVPIVLFSPRSSFLRKAGRWKKVGWWVLAAQPHTPCHSGAGWQRTLGHTGSQLSL